MQVVFKPKRVNVFHFSSEQNFRLKWATELIIMLQHGKLNEKTRFWTPNWSRCLVVTQISYNVSYLEMKMFSKNQNLEKNCASKEPRFDLIFNVITSNFFLCALVYCTILTKIFFFIRNNIYFFFNDTTFNSSQISETISIVPVIDAADDHLDEFRSLSSPCFTQTLFSVELVFFHTRSIYMQQYKSMKLLTKIKF